MKLCRLWKVVGRPLIFLQDNLYREEDLPEGVVSYLPGITREHTSKLDDLKQMFSILIDVLLSKIYLIIARVGGGMYAITPYHSVFPE